MRTSRPLVADHSPAQGAGVANVASALSRLADKQPLPTAATAGLPASTGLGSLEASRGGEHVADPANGVELVGEYDALGSPWNAAAWVTAEDAGTTWVKGSWNNRTWAGTKWDKKQLQGAQWTGTSWSGAPWADHTWSDAQWEARTWRGNSWRARTWRAETWSARTWRSND
jgi:serine protease AprX